MSPNAHDESQSDKKQSEKIQPTPPERNRSASARFIVGIDLGTTNTVLSYVDTHRGDKASIQALPILQHVAPSTADRKESLPSFLYLKAGPEFTDDALDLPWATDRSYTVGWLAREQGAKVPSRLVASAKSWLCHPSEDLSAPILPWEAPDDVDRISPVQAATRYLEHLRDAWNHQMAATDNTDRLENQHVFLTVPASFDAVARQLTSSAAMRAGLTVTLLEEPQAAFYAWLACEAETWRDQLHVGDIVLVCDVGGGTTDFSLIAVSESSGSLVLERVAVGDHILLGGDNMDLALAVLAGQRLEKQGHALDPWQNRSLWYACRDAKERLLSDPSIKSTPVTVLGRGSKVIGGSIRTELTRADLTQLLLDGFFPQCDTDARPQSGPTGGLHEMGLPYASDAAITKHLAKFLAEHATGDTPVQPTAVLYNGGVMKAALLQQRITNQLNNWLADDDKPPIRELTSNSLDLAVSAGAAYYGQVQRGRGVRIRGGVGRSYYVGIESAMPAVPGLPAPLKALCVVPFGMEEGTEASIEQREFGMVIGQPVEFRFLSSNTRKQDTIGTLVDRWTGNEIEELSPIQTALPDEEKRDPDQPPTVPVRLHSRVTEVGTLDLELRARDGRSWKLEYNVRA